MSDPSTIDPLAFAKQLRVLAAEAPDEDSRTQLEQLAAKFENEVTTTRAHAVDAVLIVDTDGTTAIGFLLEIGDVYQTYALVTKDDFSDAAYDGAFHRLIDAVEAVVSDE